MTSSLLPPPMGFAGNPLDRAGVRRSDEAWVAARLADSRSRFLPLWRLKPLVRGEGSALAPAFLPREAAAAGLEGDRTVLLGEKDGVAHFALDASRLSEEAARDAFGAYGTFEDLLGAAARIASADGAILAAARALIDWHARHGFCAVCGGRTVSRQAGFMRLCGATGCAAQHFPRTDPVVIALIHKGDTCLLGRQPRFPPRWYSTLAGFVEPGETIEEAVRREVAEESGIVVGAVTYRMSQPWPFPSSLMIGCLGEALSETVTVDKAELEDARWFDRAEVLAALEGSANAPLSLPPPLAVAHHLIALWATG